jgi:predicted dehydrogenase
MLRFGLVGTGHWARSTHAAALASAPGVCLEAVWGRDHGAAAELAAQHGAKAHEHIAEADELVSAVEWAGVASVVFFTLRFDPRIRAWLADVAARAERAGGGWADGAAEWLGAALRPSSPFDVRFGRDVTAVLAAAQAQLDASSGSTA